MAYCAGSRQSPLCDQQHWFSIWSVLLLGAMEKKTKRSCSKTLDFLRNTNHRYAIAGPRGEIWHVFCAFKVWSLLYICTLQWRHNGCDGVSNQQHHHCLLNILFRRRSKKTTKLCASGLCAGNSPVIGEFLEQMSSDAENVSIWRLHHELSRCVQHHIYNNMQYYDFHVKYFDGKTMNEYLKQRPVALWLVTQHI